jgi:hypothetical protein
MGYIHIKNDHEPKQEPVIPEPDYPQDIYGGNKSEPEILVFPKTQ